MVHFIFWLSVAALFGTYAFYPLSLYVVGRFRRLRQVQAEEIPPVSLIICAYNEAEVIAEKIENSLGLDYLSDRLEVIFVSDASTDGTDEIVASYADRGVLLLRQEEREGKSAGLNLATGHASGSILIFSDANSIYDSQAIRHLVRHFADPHVGYVVGCQKYVSDDASASSESEGLYWRYETLLKQLETRCNSVVGGDGAIYAIRAELFRPLRADEISDFVNPLQIIARGYRGVYDVTAVCYESTANSFAGEFYRKMRIVNRSVRGVCRVPQALNPLRVGWFAYQLVLHKVIRWFVAFFMVAALAANIAIVASEGGWLYHAALAAQIAFYALAAMGTIPRLRRFKFISVPFYFCLVNAAAGLGVLAMLFGIKFTTWKPQRSGSQTAALGRAA